MFKKNQLIQLSIALFIMLGAAVACTSTQAPSLQSAAASPSSNITVVGRGEAFGEPDQAQAQVGVETFAATAQEATSQNTAILQQVTAALEAQGIAKEDIQTTNYSLWAEQIYGERGPEGIAGYRVNNQVNIVIRDIDKIGDVLTAVTEAGANAIFGVSFSVDDPAQLEAQAREAAMADARKRAESLAQLSGLTLGKVQIVSEVIGQSTFPPFAFGGGDLAMESAAGPGISPGQLSFNIQIQVTFNAG